MIRFLKPPAAAVAAIACGAAVSSGLQYGIWLAALVPAMFMAQRARRQSLRMALLYYLGASWPIVIVFRNYVRFGGGLWIGLLVWVAASCALALPWLWAWAPRSNEALWRTPVAILLTAVPPLGIIAWAHPFTAAGILFPGSRWLGLVATLMLPGLLIARPKHTLAAYASAVLLLNEFCGNACSGPPGWAAVDTHFGNVAGSILTEYAAAQWVWERTQGSSAKVLLFPESVIPHWTKASISFLSE